MYSTHLCNISPKTWKWVFSGVAIPWVLLIMPTPSVLRESGEKAPSQANSVKTVLQQKPARHGLHWLCNSSAPLEQHPCSPAQSPSPPRKRQRNGGGNAAAHRLQDGSRWFLLTCWFHFSLHNKNRGHNGCLPSQITSPFHHPQRCESLQRGHQLVLKIFWKATAFKP